VSKLNFLAEFDGMPFNTGNGTVSLAAFLPGQDPLDPATILVATGEGTFAFRWIVP